MTATPSGVSRNPKRKNSFRTAPLARALTALGTAAILATGATRAGDLTFQERLKAQEAIQRVYYSHQLGATLPFEQAYPRDLLQRQVEDYLKKSAALEAFWKAPVTAAALRGELERIAKKSRLPERLREVYSALDYNPVLIEECFARPSLVDRLTRNFFSTDQRVHASQRQQAEALRDRLVLGNLALDAADSHRTVGETAMGSELEGNEPGAPASSRSLHDEQALPRRRLPQAEFRRWRSSLPAKVGEVGRLADRTDEFIFQVVLSEEPEKVRVATYSVPKKGYAAWWEENRGDFHEESVPTLASADDPVPVIGALATPPWKPATLAQPNLEAGPDAVTSATCLQASWDNAGMDNLPEPRSQHTAVWTGSLMLIWGGQNSSGPLNTGAKYDPLTDTWSSISNVNAPSARSLHTAIWTGQVMIIWGGGDYTKTGGRYDPSTDSWIPTSTLNAPGGRDQHTAVWTGTEMIVFGGWVPGADARQGGRYNPTTDSWIPMALGGARYRHTAVWTGSEMLVWGGLVTSPAIASPVKYTPNNDQWSSFSDVNQPAARYGHGAVWTGTRMIIWGGTDGSTNLATGGQYNPANNSWTSTSTANAAIGSRPSGFWTGTVILTWSSAPNVGSFAKRYNPATDTWISASALNSPTNRYDASAVWTGSQMIVWGGAPPVLPASATLGSGARYDFASDTWTPTSLAVPEARQGHTAVWTGSQMIVWGGRVASQDFSVDSGVNTGGRYDPLIDSWTPTSTTGAPSGRSGHSAIWSGAQMIIWGGSHSAALDTGGRYDPVSDTWNPTSTTSTPAARYAHTAVWTGTRMIVWGGRAASAYLNTGGVYNPSADTWTATSTTNAPEGRYLHTATWTGSRMIVWGGLFVASNLNHFLGTGGEYIPSNNHWSATSTTNAPIARAGHTAVWTGTRVLIWGGLRESTYLNTGSQYNPQTDEWTVISSTAAPHARLNHTAVWTGSEMVVWGGVLESAGSQVGDASGGVYFPSMDAWIATPTTGAPSARFNHTAIWTGTHMIVWSGLARGYTQSGGRLRLDTLADVDSDLDGFGACSGDCNDGDASIHPGAAELCNGLDDNCAVGIDEPFDQDQDGFASCGGDCNDASAAINPAAPEICNHLDDNCDYSVDEGFADADLDGYAVCIDCNDNDFSIHPGGFETCNGADDDCDASVDEGGIALCDFDPEDCFLRTCGGISGCSSTPLSSGTPCSDFNACTQTDVCNATGQCQGSNPLVCTAPDSCHEAGTCSPQYGCINQYPKPIGTLCDDSDPCTLWETCNILGSCGGGTPKDYDFDGHVDTACGGNDCDDATANVWSAPQEVTNLGLTTASPANPTWGSQADAAGWGTVYDLTSGMLTGSGGLDTASSVCLASGTGSTNYNDTRPDPAAGTGFWYLTRARNSCGTGTYGAASDAVERTILACP